LVFSMWYRLTKIVWSTGSELLRPHFLVLLAEAYGRVGQAEEGLGALTEALAVVDKTGERADEAELYQLKGELTLAQSSVQGPASRVRKSSASGVRGPASPNLSPQHLAPMRRRDRKRRDIF
jgi:hypothetical protein